MSAIRIIKQLNEKPSGAVIFFHGSGDTGDGIYEWVNSLVRKVLQFDHLKIIYPTAPLQPYTPFGGELSNVWFDRPNISPKSPENQESLNKISVTVKQLIKQQETEDGIPTNRIIVGGFSNGGGLALHTGYRWCPNVAGTFALSAFLNKDSSVYENLKNSSNTKFGPLFMCHGDQDDLIPLQWADETFKTLQSLGINGKFHKLENTAHSLNLLEINKLISWILKVLPPLDN